ncbi:MAG: thiol protease/hemagglutinin PrtT [Bacteroidetes bacterium]|nr:thiol protease/hemagglutinin PrtT [Bacteroidota bacterium]
MKTILLSIKPINHIIRLSFIVLCITLFFHQNLIAKHINPSEAIIVAKHFYQSTEKGASIAEHLQLTPVYGINGYNLSLESELIHIFNVNESDGFVLVAGDDAIIPILGYAEKGSFDPENLPVNLAKWLDSYQREVRFAIDNKVQATSDIKDHWEVLKNGTLPNHESGDGVLPLLTTTWNQSPYYNDDCPGGSVTGCVATAMAQVMNYWEYPIRGSGYHAYFELGYGVLTANYFTTYYQWWNMPDNVTSPNESVAELMYQCGVSVEMDYNPTSSGANPSKIKNALESFFGYDPAMQFLYKEDYSSATWNSLMVTELDASRPIFYGGYSSSTGHGFVCDGYMPFLSDNEHFHINWGWGGAFDGYFALNALTPNGTGTGGGNSNDGYNSDQVAIIGIQPNPNDPPSLELVGEPLVTDTIFEYGKNYSVIGNVRNTGLNTFNGKIAAAVYTRHDDSFIAYLDSTDVSIVGPGGIGIGNYSDQISLLPGFYYISYVYKAENSDNWVQIESSPTGDNRTDIIVLDITGGNQILWLFEEPSSNTLGVHQNAAFTVSATLGNLTTVPSWSGEVAAELYNLDFEFVQTIDKISNITIDFANTDYSVMFTSFGVNVPPGAYLIALRAKRNNSTEWAFPLALEDVSSTAPFNILPSPLNADAYEPNNSLSDAYPLGVSFTNDNATLNTQGSNMHDPEDYDFYKIDLPAGYDYEITPRVHDSYHSGNGQSYTNDVRFLYAINDDPFSNSWDDIPSPASFTVIGDNTVYFRVNPYYLGTLGTYLLDVQITRTPSTSVNDLFEEEHLRVYPNPVDSYLMVDFSNMANKPNRVNLYKTNGQLVYSQNVYNEWNNQINTSELNDGIYFLSIFTETGNISKKIKISH